MISETVNFTSAASFKVENKPMSFAVGDVNGDGFDDLISPNSQASNISIRLGNGQGGFGGATDFATGNQPMSLAVGDFNGDGFVDVVTANIDDQNASLLLGNGQGSFGAATSVPLGNFPEFVTAGNFNSDRIADLLTVTRGTNDVSILLNNTVIPPKNNPPIVGKSIADQTIVTGNALKFVIDGDTFTDPDPGDVLSYSARLADGKSLPTWLTFDSTTITFAGTPAVADIANLSITITATDRSGATVASSFGLNVSPAAIPPKNNPPIVGKSIANQTIITGNALKFVIDGTTFTDPDPGDLLSYSAKLANGKSLPTWLTFDPTTRTFTGTPAVADVANLNIAITATDQSGATVASNFGLNVSPAVIPPPQNPSNVIDLRSVSDQPIQATFNVQRNSTYDSNVSFYNVEDPQGTIISKTGIKLKPGDSGYLIAAIENRLTNIDLLGINSQTINSTSTIRGGAIYAPLLNANSKLFNPQLGNIYTAYSAANNDKAEHIKLIGENTFGFEDLKGGGDKDFNDIIIKADFKVASPIVNGTQAIVLDTVKFDPKLPNNPTAINLNLTSYTGQTLKADITNSGNGVYNNNIGFYVVEDSIGSIKLSDGRSLKPGDANYAVEAAKNALTNSLQAGKNVTKTDINIAGGKFYAPIVVAQGTLNDFITKNPTNGGGAKDIHAYFSYRGANSDKIDHFRLIGNNTFGFEDMFGGGDRDFNDLVVNLTVKSVV